MGRISGVTMLEILGAVMIVLLIPACGTPVWQRSLDLTSEPPTSAPAGTPTNTPTTATTPSAVPQVGTLSTDQVKIMVSQNAYRSSEEVKFAIKNNLERSIYYTYGGCGWPSIYKVEDEGRVGLTVNILEEAPAVTELTPGETRTCVWDQKAWQNPDKKGHARFRSHIELAPVPPGQYQFVFRYFLDKSDVHSYEKAETVYSQLFTIR
jgi:hypothetical protein